MAQVSVTDSGGTICINDGNAVYYPEKTKVDVLAQGGNVTIRWDEDHYVVYAAGDFTAPTGTAVAIAAAIAAFLNSGTEVSGSGTTNYISKWTASTTLGNSSLFDNGTSVGFGTATPSAKAAFDITSTTQGVLLPRLTTAQQNAITSPPTSLLIFNTTTGLFQYYTGAAWVALDTGTLDWTQGGNAYGATGTLGLTDNFGMNIITNNATRMSILSTGEVGIGMTPSNFVDIGNNQNSATIVGINNTTSGLASAAVLALTSNVGSGALAVYSSTYSNSFIRNATVLSSTGGNLILSNDSSFYTYINNGNVGINLTTAPAAKLHIVGAGTTSATYGLQVHNSTGTNNALVVRDDGFVGVGTSAPATPLEITSSGNLNTIKINQSGNGAGIYTDRSNNNVYSGLLYATSGTVKWILSPRGDGTENFYMYNYTINKPVMLWDANSGFLSIGYDVSTPSAALHIKGAGTTSTTYTLKVQNSASTALFNIQDDGAIGIRNSSPSYDFDIISTTNIKERVNGNGILYLQSNNNHYSAAFRGGGDGAEIVDFFSSNSVFARFLGNSFIVGSDASNINSARGSLDMRSDVSLNNNTLATVGSQLVNSSVFNFNGYYWNGSASTSANMKIQTIVSSTVPAYRLGILDNSNNELVSILNNGNVGIGTNAPTSILSVTQSVATTGSPTCLLITGGAHTTLTASTEAIDVNVNLARTVQFLTGALTTQRAMLIQAPTYGFVGASTITNAATLAISDAPSAGTNATITNASALWIQAGALRLDGRLLENQGADIASASTIALGSDGNVFEITGTTTINLITATGWRNGSVITLVFNASLTVNHGTATSGSDVTILLAGAANFSATVNDTLTLVLCENTANGQAWRELARTAI